MWLLPGCSAALWQCRSITRATDRPTDRPTEDRLQRQKQERPLSLWCLVEKNFYLPKLFLSFDECAALATCDSCIAATASSEHVWYGVVCQSLVNIGLQRTVQDMDGDSQDPLGILKDSWIDSNNNKNVEDCALACLWVGLVGVL